MKWWYITSFCLLSVAVLVFTHLGYRLSINTTQSVLPGIYLITPAIPSHGDLAAVMIPDKARFRYQDRPWLPPPDVPQLKRVVAVEGDNVCVKEGVVSINGTVIVTIRQMDSEKLPLWPLPYCDTLTQGWYFFINQPDLSFDSRYYGPLSKRQVKGRVSPIWVFDS